MEICLKMLIELKSLIEEANRSKSFDIIEYPIFKSERLVNHLKMKIVKADNKVLVAKRSPVINTLWSIELEGKLFFDTSILNPIIDAIINTIKRYDPINGKLEKYGYLVKWHYSHDELDYLVEIEKN